MKKRMEKILSLVLSIVFILSFSISAIAVEDGPRFKITVLRNGIETAKLNVGDTITVNVDIINLVDTEMKYAALQFEMAYNANYFDIIGEPVSPIGGTAVSKPNEGSIRMGRFGAELSLTDGSATVLTFTLVVKEDTVASTSINLTGGLVADFAANPIFEGTATIELAIKAQTTVIVTQPNGVYGQPLPALSKSAENEGTNGVWYITYLGSGDTEYENSKVPPTAVGDYAVWVDYFSDEYDGYAIVPFSIVKAPLAVKPASKNIYAGDSLPTSFELVYTGFVNGDTASVLSISGAPVYMLKNGDSNLESSNAAGLYSIFWSNKDGVTIESDNYAITKADGVLTISNQPSTGGNESGGGSGSPVTPPKPTENPDGSKTTAETDKKTGTVTETTKYPDGKIKVVETYTDGTIAVKVETANGTKTEQVQKPDGSMTAVEARKDGVKVESETTSDGNTTAVVTMPESANKVVVTIPTPTKPMPGEVAVIVSADGTKEILKTSVCTEDGMRVTLAQGAKLEIIDSSKYFADVLDTDWAVEAVQFAVSRGLFNGTSAGSFSPSQNMNRAMLITVLARLDGQDTSFGANWYEGAMGWAQNSGITTVAAPEDDITREQMVVILHRYSGAPDASEASLEAFSDADRVSAWSESAMRWAVETGIINGKGGNLNPTGTASRAEVSAILQRFIEGL